MSIANADTPLAPERLLELPNVSRETLDRFQDYAALLLRWQERMNLVGPETLADPWRRHFLDSAQLAAFIDPADRVVTDLGSGAGFPGLVLAIMTGLETHLVEANGRKAAFLREAARVCEAPVTVHQIRIEKAEYWATDIITARALAPVARLLELSEGFSANRDETSPICLFLKGETVQTELTEARKEWNMRTELARSLSNPLGHVLRIAEFGRISGAP